MSMRKSLTKFRRDRWVNQVIAVGRQLRSAEAARNGVNAANWPHDAEYLDAAISRLTNRRDRLLTKLKETA